MFCLCFRRGNVLNMIVFPFLFLKWWCSLLTLWNYLFCFWSILFVVHLLQILVYHVLVYLKVYFCLQCLISKNFFHPFPLASPITFQRLIVCKICSLLKSAPFISVLIESLIYWPEQNQSMLSVQYWSEFFSHRKVKKLSATLFIDYLLDQKQLFPVSPLTSHSVLQYWIKKY